MAHLEWNVATAIEVDEVQKVLNKISGDRDEGSVQRERPKLQEKSELVQATAMGCSRYLVINTVVTEPQNKGHGVASELIGMVTDYADTEALSIIAQVPPSAAGAFQQASFREIVQ